MAIKIYDYHNPFQLNKESYWEELAKCPYFCVSHTLANGLKQCYWKDFKDGQVATVQDLLEAVYPDWFCTETVIKQHAVIDRVLSRNIIKGNETDQNIKRAFSFNRDDIFKSVRILCELEIDPSVINRKLLTPEQEYLLDIYDTVITGEDKGLFQLIEIQDKERLNEAVYEALSNDLRDPELPALNTDCVVLHGIHQFSPAILRLIELLSGYVEVILLFNYQPQYQNIYQSWIDIYSLFDVPITKSSVSSYRPTGEAIRSNELGSAYGKLYEGNVSDISLSSDYELIEFNNKTEFANYVAEHFKNAVTQDPVYPLRRMDERIYSTDSSVNDILKVYFPEQYGELQFLNYPLGHFFISIANMWDSETNGLKILNLLDVKECLKSGIIHELRPGMLASVFGKVEPLFEGCNSLAKMCDLIRTVIQIKDSPKEEYQDEMIKRISYYNVSRFDLKNLLRALEDLEELAKYFYSDFDKQPQNFKKFYIRLKNYLESPQITEANFNEEFQDILKRILLRLDEVTNIETSGSLECLKSTMNIYLQQEPKDHNGGSRIVRNFEQIDGDILNPNYKKNSAMVFHFAGLSDEEMNMADKRAFPWPLNEEFLVEAQEPLDTKIQIFVRSKLEYKNFRKYALLFGLQFNQVHFKLSYIKHNGDKECNPYYPLTVLGVKTVKYSEKRTDQTDCKEMVVSSENDYRDSFLPVDLYRFRICKYRFLLESLTESATVYKDVFLLEKYLEVLVEHELIRENSGYPVNEIYLLDDINSAFDSVKEYFPFVVTVNRMDIIKAVHARALNYEDGEYPELNDSLEKHMQIREDFIHRKLMDQSNHVNVFKDVFTHDGEEQVKATLSNEHLKKCYFDAKSEIWCQYCSDRELCLNCNLNLNE